MKIQIKPGLEIGEGCPPFIICEIGSNWRTKQDCIDSIAKAKACGASAVKFQLFTHDALYAVDTRNYTCLTVPRAGDSPYLDPAWLPALKEKADACGIELMCSAFSPELIDVVDKFVNVHKVASSEMCHVRMLERLREIGKPVLLSTGAQNWQDVEQAVRVLGETSTVLLYCVAAYPAKTHYITVPKAMAAHFRKLVGFSDHSLDNGITAEQMEWQGACVFEKHVNFSERQDTPDAPHSLAQDEFQLYTRRLKLKWSRESICTTQPYPEELPMVLRHKRRILATRDLEPGDVLQEGVNFGIYRSLIDDTKAMSPWMVDEANGRTVKNTMKAGEGIGPGDVG